MEGIIESVGGFGRFQWMLLFTVSTSISVFSFSMLIMTFGGLVPEWWCSPDDELSSGNLNTSNPYFHSCPGNSSEICHMTYENYTRTVVSEFDLVCGKSWIEPSLTSIQMAGVLVGALLGGQSGDMFGRKKTFYLSLLLHCIFNIVTAFSVNWQMFAVMLFLIGLTIGMFTVMAFYPLEFIGMKRRAVAIAIPFWSTGICVLALASYLIHDWKYLHITCGILTFPFLFGWFIVPESARWLATKDRIEEAIAVIEKIARINGTTVPDNTETVLRKVAAQDKGGRKYTYLDIYRGKPILKFSIIIQLIWFSLSGIYYGLVFGMNDFSGNFYLNLFLTGVLVCPISILSMILLNKIGRRLTGIIVIFLAAGFCISVLITQEVMDVTKNTLITVFSVAVLLMAEITWTAMLLLASETYPTVIRYLGMGAGDTFARLGAILAPFIFNLGQHRMIPYIILSSLTIFCGFGIWMLNDTTNMAMRDVTDEESKHDPGTPTKDGIVLTKISRNAK